MTYQLIICYLEIDTLLLGSTFLVRNQYMPTFNLFLF